MATIEFDYLYIHLASDPEQQRRFWVGEGSEEFEADATVRRYGGGNTRATRGPGLTRTVPYTLVDVSRDDMEWLRSVAGAPLLFRDPRRRAEYGVFPRGSVTELPGLGGTVDVGLEVQITTAAAEEPEAVV